MGGALLVLYAGSYVLNSSLGGYWNKPERDGHDRWVFGLSIHTAILWQPRIGYWAPFRSDCVGAFYSPLVRIDRWLFHPTHYLTDPDIGEWTITLTPKDFHPRFRAAWTAELAHRDR